MPTFADELRSPRGGQSSDVRYPPRRRLSRGATAWRRLSRGQSLRSWAGEVLRFLGVGGLAYLVDVGVFNLLVYGPGGLLGEPGQMVAAKALSAGVSVLVAWIGNRRWTFRDRRSPRPAHELVGFVAINVLALAVTVGALAIGLRLGVRSAVGVNLAANVVGVGLGTLVRYVGYRYVLFTGDRGGARR